MIEGRVIRGIDMNDAAFVNSFKRLKGEALMREVLDAIRQLLGLAVDRAPRKLHLHQLHDKLVPSRLDKAKKVPAWSFHVTANDAYKASFTWEGGTAYLRLVAEHDVIDKTP